MDLVITGTLHVFKTGVAFPGGMLSARRLQVYAVLGKFSCISVLELRKVQHAEETDWKNLESQPPSSLILYQTMATNTRSSKTPSFDDVTPSLGGNITSLLAIRQNAEALLHHMEQDQDFGVEEYAGQRVDLIKGLQKILKYAPDVANVMASSVNVWNTIGAASSTAPKSADFVVIEENDPSSAPSVQQLLQLFNKTQIIDDISDKINGTALPVPVSPKTLKGLENALNSATKDNKAAEQSFVEVKAKAQGGKEDPAIKAADALAQLALLDQISAYNDLTSAKLLNSFGSSEIVTLTWPSLGDIGKFVSGAISAVEKGAQVAGAVATIRTVIIAKGITKLLPSQSSER
ncbi:hypothetical protein DL96DRAFT_1775824 [Flagelloscypha sp. PMI_526]|nr:hypothetical protein DL96DRAFT_1775824 [Flagelloscypha sp. PMI_526]